MEVPDGLGLMAQCGVSVGGETWQGIELPRLSVRDVADKLGVSCRAVWRFVADGQFPRPARLGRLCRWFISDVRDYLDKLKAQREQAKEKN